MEARPLLRVLYPRRATRCHRGDRSTQKRIAALDDLISTTMMASRREAGANCLQDFARILQAFDSVIALGCRPGKISQQYGVADECQNQNG